MLILGVNFFAPHDFGNYNFGVAGKADGIPLEIALLGAVAYQIYSGTSNKKWIRSVFDDPRDAIMIRKGLNISNRMMKIPSALILLTILSCGPKASRDKINFNDDFQIVENKIKRMNILLQNLPLPHNSENAYGYYVEIHQGDTLLYINRERIGKMKRADSEALKSAYSEAEIQELVDLSHFLFKNNIYLGVKQCSFWEFVITEDEKFERDQYRSLVYDESLPIKYTDCDRDIIERQGNLSLIRVKYRKGH